MTHLLARDDSELASENGRLSQIFIALFLSLDYSSDLSLDDVT